MNNTQRINTLESTVQALHAQNSTMIALLEQLTGQESKTASKTADLPEVTSVACVALTKAGKACKSRPVTGTDMCIGHTRQAQAQAQAPKRARKSRQQKSVAKNSLTVKANRAGAHVAIQALDDALQAGTSLVYVRSNVGARKVNTALRKRGYTVGNMRKDGDVRTWDVSGHGHTYEHRMGKYVQGQTAHHRQMVKIA